MALNEDIRGVVDELLEVHDRILGKKAEGVGNE